VSGSPVLADRETRLQINRRLRLLLGEGTPLVDRGRVLASLEESLHDHPTSLLGALSAMRAQLRDLLRGTQPGQVRVVLPEDLENDLRAGLTWDAARGSTRARIAGSCPGRTPSRSSAACAMYGMRREVPRRVAR